MASSFLDLSNEVGLIVSFEVHLAEDAFLQEAHFFIVNVHFNEYLLKLRQNDDLKYFSRNKPIFTFDYLNACDIDFKVGSVHYSIFIKVKPGPNQAASDRKCGNSEQRSGPSRRSLFGGLFPSPRGNQLSLSFFLAE